MYRRHSPDAPSGTADPVPSRSVYPAPNQETERAFRERLVRANDVLNGTVNLAAYPFRYLLIGELGMSGGRKAVLTAVEWLEQYGWEVVSGYWDEVTNFTVMIRRVQAQPQPQPQPQPQARPQDT